MLAVALAASGGAQAQGNSTQAPQVWRVASLEGVTQYAQASTSQTDIPLDPGASLVIVGADFPKPESWDAFGRSVSGAATSSCFGADALSHQGLVVEGLLRLPFLLHAAAAGTCR
jgi:hypothetical protein